jgi:hypothetical protein
MVYANSSNFTFMSSQLRAGAKYQRNLTVTAQTNYGLTSKVCAVRAVSGLYYLHNMS